MTSDGFAEGDDWGGRPIARRVADATERGRVLVTGTVRRTGTTNLGGSVSYLCTVEDGTGEIGLLFVGRRSVPGLVRGARCTVEGTARRGRGRLVLWNPRYRLESPLRASPPRNACP